MTDRTRLQQMLRPRSAVFIGGSGVVPEAVDYCRSNRFTGNLYVVNPFKETLAGLPCYAAVADLPEVPDVAFVGVPKEAVVETVQALTDFGVGGAIVNSSGFSEIEGEGVERQQAFVTAAGEMPVIGPNCPGVANFLDNAAFMQGHFGDHADVEKGVAVISNGGAYLSDAGTSDRSVPLAYSFGLGNQAMVSVADLLDVVLDDDRVLAVNLYLESVQDVAKLSRAALRATRKGVPIVVVKGGRSSAGQRATQTHTASLAGDDVVLSALFRRLGFVMCSSPDEALETLKMLIFGGRPQGRRLAFTTSSGSYAVLGSDAAEAAGLEIPPLSEQLHADLTPLLPSFILPANPLDISTGHYFDEDRQRGIYRTFLTGAFDAAVQVMCYPPVGGWEPEPWDVCSSAFGKEAHGRGLPAAFINTLAETLPRPSREKMITNGIAPLQGLQHGFQAVANAAEFVEQAERLSVLADEVIAVEPFDSAVSGASLQLDEAAAKGMLAEAGVQVPNSAIWDGVSELDLSVLTFPVVVKAISAEITHKTEVGAVKLHLNHVEEVKTAVTEMAERLDEYVVSGYLIEEMVSGIAELLVGIRVVSDIGLALTLAFGGTAVELIRDSATLILPAPPSEIEQALRSLKLFPLIAGWRGKPAADLGQVVEAIGAICDIAQQERESLIALEINPVIIRTDGRAPVAVDAVYQFKSNR